MRVISFLIIVLLVVASCNNSDKKTDEDKLNEQLAKVLQEKIDGYYEFEKKKEEEPKELSYEEKKDSMLTAMGIKTRDWDSIYAIISDTTYANKKIKSIKLQADSCPFIPYMLIVDDNKLKFCNQSFDSAYTVNTKLKIQTASISPYNNREIFVLTQSKLEIPDEKPVDFYDYTSMINLNLYKLNLDSMFMEGITTLYDNSIPFLKVQMEMVRFFPDTAELKIDTTHNLIYYNCILEAFADEAYMHGTYVVNLNKGRTTLGKLKGFKPNFIKGDDIPLYSNSHLKNHRFKTKVIKDDILISEIPDNKPSVKIPKYILSHSPNERIIEKGLEWSDFFNICFLKNDEKIIFSYCREQEMGQLTGNIYFASTTGGGQPKLIIKERVIGYESDIRKIDDSFYLIELQPGPGIFLKKELLIYDTNFNLVKQFKKMNHYELFPR